MILGMNAKLYYASSVLTGDSSSDANGADWNEISNVRDVTVDLSTGEADVTTRANQGWRQTAATLKEGSLEFEMIWLPGDAAFEAVRDAWLGSTEIALAAMDQDIETSGAQGLVSNFTITNFTRTEPLEDAIKVSITAKPSSETQWYEV